MAAGRLDEERVREAAQVLLEHRRRELPSVSVAVAAGLLAVSRTTVEAWRQASGLSGEARSGTAGSTCTAHGAPPVPEHPLSGRHAPGPHHRVRPGRRDPPRARPRLHPAVAGRRPPPRLEAGPPPRPAVTSTAGVVRRDPDAGLASEQAEGEPEHGRSRPEPGPIRGSRAASDTRDVRNRFPRLSPEKSRTQAASCRYGGGGIARDPAGSGARPVPDSRSSGVALAEEVPAGSDQDDGPDRRDQELRPR